MLPLSRHNNVFTNATIILIVEKQKLPTTYFRNNKTSLQYLGTIIKTILTIHTSKNIFNIF